MERYESYKDSGVDWIGEIPDHWEVARLKNHLVDRKEKNNPIKTDFVLSLTNVDGVIPYSEKGDKGNKAKEDISGYMIAYPGDIVLNSMNVVIGSVGLSSYYGAVSPVYYMLHTRYNEDVRYFNYLFQTSTLQNELKGLGNGILEIRMRIPMSKLNNVILPIPPKIEMRIISDYLDEKTSEIDSLIEKTERSIELLEEYRKSVISEAVTKGLDPDAPMKDSGIEWIGEIPAHWTAQGFTRPIESITDYRGRTPKKADSGRFLITGRNIKNGRIDYDASREYIPESEYNRAMQRGRLIKRAVLFTMEAPLGQAAVVDDDSCAAAQRIIMLVPDVKRLNGSYLVYWIMSNQFQSNLLTFATGSTASGIKASKLNQLKVILPPLPEQNRIASFLDTKTLEIDALVTSQRKQIDLLREYRKSLISEAVTGKFKVPGVA
ncbi:restriction endonuclease subunit S [Adlercreutzia sp. ZJ141]|uniref:restriction endonuclease subunit S n=1 Tax=Adlercreutzia sp. ZJ141 TaxID=2709406 RepID=UPI0013EB35AF|nr:restriction endonuclease subunit S [Adlercreutzia sp. ZJ141]